MTDLPAVASDQPPVSVEVRTQSAEETAEVGRRLAALVRSGDVVILAGELGAGKTTLTRGLGAGLQVRGAVTSPTFVLSRVHAADAGKVALVHADAYRLGDAAELDDLDLDAFVDGAVTVVEWGDGVAEALSADRLRVHLRRSRGVDQGDDLRVITVTAVGSRWVGVPLRSLADRHLTVDT